MSLTTPRRIRELQIKLYRKAKNEHRTWKVVAATGGLVRESAVKPVGKPDALCGPQNYVASSLQAIERTAARVA